MELPDLASYTPHKVIDDIDLEGVVVLGLRADFLRRPLSALVATVGVYRLHGIEIFMAWGYVGEPHCRWTAYRRDDGVHGGGWTAPHQGCPRLRRVEHALLLETGERVIELPVARPLLPAQAPPVVGSMAQRPAADRGCPSAR